MNKWVRRLAPWWDQDEAQRKELASVALADHVDRQLDRLEQERAEQVRANYAESQRRLHR